MIPLIIAIAILFTATVIYLKSKSSPTVIQVREIPDETPTNLRYISDEDFAVLCESFEESSFRNPRENDGEYCARLRSLIVDLETVVLYSAKVHLGERRLREDKKLQKQVASLLSLRRRILDQLFFMAGNREERLALVTFNRDLKKLEARGLQIIPKAGVDTCRYFTSDGLYSSKFATLLIILSVMQPEYYEETYSDFVYADSSLDAFEGMNLSGSIIELHRRLYSLADLARIKIQALTKNTKRNNGSKNTHIS